MRLMAVHRLFIGAAIALAVVYATREVLVGRAQESPGWLPRAIASFVVAVALAAYYLFALRRPKPGA